MEDSTSVHVPDHFLQDIKSKKVYQIRGTQKIGRKNCDIILQDKDVSGTHCQLKASGLSLTVTDLKSTNGTFVNRKRIASDVEVRLSPGDELRTGNISFLYSDARPVEEVKFSDLTWKEKLDDIFNVSTFQKVAYAIGLMITVLPTVVVTNRNLLPSELQFLEAYSETMTRMGAVMLGFALLSGLVVSTHALICRSLKQTVGKTTILIFNIVTLPIMIAVCWSIGVIGYHSAGANRILFEDFAYVRTKFFQDPLKSDDRMFNLLSEKYQKLKVLLKPEDLEKVKELLQGEFQQAINKAPPKNRKAMMRVIKASFDIKLESPETDQTLDTP